MTCVAHAARRHWACSEHTRVSMYNNNRIDNRGGMGVEKGEVGTTTTCVPGWRRGIRTALQWRRHSEVAACLY